MIYIEFIQIRKKFKGITSNPAFCQGKIQEFIRYINKLTLYAIKEFKKLDILPFLNLDPSNLRGIQEPAGQRQLSACCRRWSHRWATGFFSRINNNAYFILNWIPIFIITPNKKKDWAWQDVKTIWRQEGRAYMQFHKLAKSLNLFYFILF